MGRKGRIGEGLGGDRQGETLEKGSENGKEDNKDEVKEHGK